MPAIGVGWRKIRVLCLASAIHGESFRSVGPQFQDDIPFILKVLGHHPEMCSEVKGEAKTDHVVMTTAFTSLLVAGHRMTELHLKGQDHEINDYLIFLRCQLVPFETFSVYILGNMPSTQSVKDTGTNLTLFNQERERETDYLGIPTGSWIRRLKQAEQNVLEAMKLWTPDASRNNLLGDTLLDRSGF
eukprot:scaffold39577_cov29-Attheya_sp.AAC.2